MPRREQHSRRWMERRQARRPAPASEVQQEGAAGGRAGGGGRAAPPRNQPTMPARATLTRLWETRGHSKGSPSETHGQCCSTMSCTRAASDVRGGPVVRSLPAGERARSGRKGEEDVWVRAEDSAVHIRREYHKRPIKLGVLCASARRRLSENHSLIASRWRDSCPDFRTGRPHAAWTGRTTQGLRLRLAVRPTASPPCSGSASCCSTSRSAS